MRESRLPLILLTNNYLMKKTITLEAVDPVEIFGVGNRILEEFITYFPGLKAVARGNEIHLEGKEEDIKEFDQKFAELVQRRHHKLNLTVFDVEDIFDGEKSSPERFRSSGDAIIVHTTDGKPIKARNENQKKMVKAYFNNDLVFAVGPAGTGKTYVAIALAVRALKNREIKRIDMIPPKRLQDFMAEGTIQIAPLAYMRGRTLDRACVILDEAQNTNMSQLKMFLTRMGVNAKFIVTGDATQVDLPKKEDSGLVRGINLLKGIKGIETIFFTNEDIVRHPLVTKIVKAFDRQESE